MLLSCWTPGLLTGFHDVLSVAYWWIGDKARAMTHIKEALKYEPDNDRFLSNERLVNGGEASWTTNSRAPSVFGGRCTPCTVTINDTEISYDRNTQNKYYNKFVNCYATNAFINPFGILSNCYANRDKLTVDLNKNKEECLNKYLKFSELKIKCNNKFCYYGAKWKNF